MRIVDGVFLTLAIACAATVYSVKHQAEVANDVRRDLQREIANLASDVGLLEADLAALEQPARLQELIGWLPPEMVLEPIGARHYVRLSDIPFRAALVVPDEAAEDGVASTDESLTTGALGEPAVSSELDLLIEQVALPQPAEDPSDAIARLLEGAR